MLEQKNVTVKAGSSFQTICPFPVGYIYQSYNSTSPANIYGGSWTPITGRFLYCNNGTGVGGSNTHTLTEKEMPKHNHPLKALAGSTYGGNSVPIANYKVFMFWQDHNTWIVGQEKGGNAAHNNMPAYQTCYAWRRTN